MLQFSELFPQFNELHRIYGHAESLPIYGAGCLNNPDVCLVFMNPTARNVAAAPQWQGLRAPWLGTKLIWKLCKAIGALTELELFSRTQSLKPSEWTAKFAEQVYQNLADNSVYLTNLAKCTQVDARALPDKVFRSYRDLMLQELALLNPKLIISFGNQVSSILLGKSISVSSYTGNEFELLQIKEQTLKVFPVYYPVGQGMRNMPLAISRINNIKTQEIFPKQLATQRI